jgi:Fe2+ transport system protein B
VISNIPAGVTVQWPDGQIDEVTDGEVRFAVDLPGTYTLTFDAVPYLEQEVTIEAVAAT